MDNLRREEDIKKNQDQTHQNSFYGTIFNSVGI